jgi:hypothetical protein
MLKRYKIFRRQASITGQDKRVRWHVVAEQVGTSRTDALRHFFGPGRKVVKGERYEGCAFDGSLKTFTAPEDGWVSDTGDVYVPNRANCAPDWNGVPTMAEQSGTVTFDHYNVLGTFVPAL